MNDNLLALAQQALGGDFSRFASQYLGESQGSTQSALSLLLPAVLGGIAQKGATPQGASSLLSLLDGVDVDALGGLFGGGGAGLDALTKPGMGELVPNLFGDKGGALANVLSSATGINAESAKKLLALVVPMILAFLKKFISAKGLNASSLSTLLASQGPYLKDALDSRLTGALGFASPSAFLSGLGSQASGMASSAVAGSAAVAANTAKKAGGMRWLPWVIAALVLLFLWSVLSKKSADTVAIPPAPPPAVTTAPAPVPAPAPAPEPPTPAATMTLPAKVYFDVDAATIGAEGSTTIADVARTINSEGLQVAVTGYTDRSGDLAMNEELAKNRVLAVVDALKAAGVPEASIHMQPPMFVEAGTGDGTDAEARRVDISRQ